VVPELFRNVVVDVDLRKRSGTFVADAPLGRFVHVGSIDIDFVVDPEIIDTERYATIVESLLCGSVAMSLCRLFVSVLEDDRVSTQRAVPPDPHGLHDSPTFAQP